MKKWNLGLVAGAALAVAALAVALSCLKPLIRDKAGVSWTRRFKLDLKVKGRRRSYLLHAPSGLRAGELLPLVVVIHGAFSRAHEIEKTTGFSLLADRESFFAVYPEGGYGLLGLLQHWNAGFCCGQAAADGLDDVGFLLRVIGDIRARFPVDPARIYMTGFSNGAMLTHRFAAEHPEILAAAAPLAGAIGGRASMQVPLWVIPQPRLPLPMLIFHGDADRSVPYAGGRSPGKGGAREYLSALAAAEFWAAANGCRSDALVENVLPGRLERRTWAAPTPGGAVVILNTLRGWGHFWPGPRYTASLPGTDPLHGYDAAIDIWEFFKKYRR
jgi:polyhydroxybutyrate depolymerase